MNMLIILLLAFAPGIFWLLYFYSKDRMEPEPRHLVMRTFIIGLIAAVPIAIVEFFFVWAGTFLLVVAVAPLIEEFGKYFSVKYSISRNPEFDEPLDGIIYGVAAALGFASIENLSYLISAAALGTDALVTTALARAFLSVPGHAIFACMWGYALGMSMLISDPVQKQRFIRKGIWTAILFHAGFNFLAYLGGLLGLIGAGGLIAGLVVAWKQVKLRIDAALTAAPRFVMEKRDDPLP